MSQLPLRIRRCHAWDLLEPIRRHKIQTIRCHRIGHGIQLFGIYQYLHSPEQQLQKQFSRLLDTSWIPADSPGHSVCGLGLVHVSLPPLSSIRESSQGSLPSFPPSEVSPNTPSSSS